MKKITAVLLTLALVVIMAAGAAVSVYASPSDVPEYIRVGIKSVSDGTTFTLNSKDGFNIYTYNQTGTCSTVKDLSSYQTVSVTAGNPEISVKDTDGNTLYSSYNNGTAFIGCTDLIGGIFTDEGTMYRGGLMLYKSESAYKYINVINTEKYLYGVLPREMSSGYPQEALKAQAVAARTYVAGNIDRKHKDQGFDLCNTQDCQVYGGVACEAPTCTSAVVETEGMIVYYNGIPAATCVYGSSNGGYIEACRDIWSADLGYLQGKEDPYDPQISWTVKYTKEELQNKVDAAGFGIGKLTGFSVLEQTPGGSVTKVELTGTNGSKVLRKSNILSFFGDSAMKSLHFEVLENEFDRTVTLPPAFDLKTQLEAGKGLSGLLAMNRSAAENQSGKVSQLYPLSSPDLFSMSQTVIKPTGIKSDVDGIVLSGKGYGHCLGMSQMGAREMAKEQFSYEEILEFYYTGAEVR